MILPHKVNPKSDGIFGKDTEKQVLGLKQAPRLEQVRDEAGRLQIASIGPDDAMNANPGRIKFSERTT